MAAGHGRADVITFLISAGATVEAMGDRGYTPVHLAALHGHAQCLKILIEAGASVQSAELEGFHPIHLAARAGHQKVKATPIGHQAPCIILVPRDTVSAPVDMLLLCLTHINTAARAGRRGACGCRSRCSVARRPNQFDPSASGCSVRAFGCCGFSGQHKR